MAKFDFGGCMQGMMRANAANMVGTVEGTITHLKGGKRQVLAEKDSVVCFVVGAEDVIVKKEDVASFECAAENVIERRGDKLVKYNSYAVTLKNGEFGTFNIYMNKAAQFVISLKP